MKKSIFIVLIFILFGFVQDNKRLKVELTLQEWEAVMNTIDQSNAPHAQVKAVQSLLIKQLETQIKQDTIKPKP